MQVKHDEVKMTRFLHTVTFFMIISEYNQTYYT